MKTGKVSGRGSGRLCRVLLAGFFVLFLALLPLGAWPMQRAEKPEEKIEIEVPIDTMAEQIPEEALPNESSGTASKDISTEQLSSLSKAEEGKRLNGDEATELYLAIVEARDEVKTARAAAEAKDAEIADLKSRLGAAEEETGTKAYLMLDGIVGFESGIPQIGAGVTVGTRIGNSLMVELGADYMIGGLNGYNQFDIDNFQFRCGVGWMF